MEQITKKAIIVEDNLILSILYENMMKQMVFKTVGDIKSGKKAVDLVKKYNPDVVIMDIMLEGETDGVQTANLIREFSDVPILFITGNSDPAHQTRARKVSNSDFLVKPINIDRLKSVVSMLLEPVG